MRPFTAVFAATAIALPWYWAVGLATNGEFLRGFFLEHNLGRATATMEHHSGSVFFYPLAILVGFFPWSVFAAPLAIDTTLQLRRSDRFHAGYLLAVCWIVVYVGVFTLARTKLPSYVTPCYPALALLIGNYIDRWSRHAAAVTGGWLFAAFASLAIVGAAIAAGLPIVARKFLPGDEWLGLIGLIPLAGGIACLALYASRKQLVAAGTFGLTAGSFVLLLFTFALPRVDRQQTNDRLLAAIDARSRDPHIAAYKTLEPSWVFYGRRPIHEIGARPDAAGQETAARAASRFLAAGDTFLITTDDRLPELMPALPPHVSVLETTPYFLHHGRKLVLLGHNTPAYRITTQPTMPGRKPGLIR
jgi:4-amino-4-deoxy-L-arabinose transferase-like glycosyltransferase